MLSRLKALTILSLILMITSLNGIAHDKDHLGLYSLGRYSNQINQVISFEPFQSGYAKNITVEGKSCIKAARLLFIFSIIFHLTFMINIVGVMHEKKFHIGW